MTTKSGKVEYGKLPRSGEKGKEVILATKVNVASIDPRPDAFIHRPDQVHVYVEVPGLEHPVAIVFTDPMQLAKIMREMATAGVRTWPKERAKVSGNGRGNGRRIQG